MFTLNFCKIFVLLLVAVVLIANLPTVTASRPCSLRCEVQLFDFDPKPIFRRHKRQVISSTALQEMRCIESCAIEFKSKLENVKQEMHANFSFMINDILLNKKSLDKTCLSFDQMETCFEQCNAQSNDAVEMIAKMTEILSIFDTVCKSRNEEFVGYFPCYTKLNELLKEQCAEKYGDPKKFDTNLKTKVKNLQVDEHFYSAVNSLMNNACDCISCYQRCQSNIIIEKCTENGQGAAEMLVALYKQMLKSMAVALKSLAPKMIIPEDCASRDVDDLAPTATQKVEKSGEAENDEEEASCI